MHFVCYGVIGVGLCEEGVRSLGFYLVLNVKCLHYHFGYVLTVAPYAVAAEFAVATAVVNGFGCCVIIDEFPTGIAEDGLTVG